jgi:hypothetical protein
MSRIAASAGSIASLIMYNAPCAGGCLSGRTPARLFTGLDVEIPGARQEAEGFMARVEVVGHQVPFQPGP